jgi:hypothetical protein
MEMSGQHHAPIQRPGSTLVPLEQGACSGPKVGPNDLPLASVRIRNQDRPASKLVTILTTLFRLPLLFVFSCFQVNDGIS